MRPRRHSDDALRRCTHIRGARSIAEYECNGHDVSGARVLYSNVASTRGYDTTTVNIMFEPKNWRVFNSI